MEDSDDDLRETPPGCSYYDDDRSDRGSPSGEGSHLNESPPTPVMLVDGDKDTPYVVKLKTETVPRRLTSEEKGEHSGIVTTHNAVPSHDANGPVDMSEVKSGAENGENTVTFTVHDGPDGSEQSPVPSPRPPDPESLHPIMPTQCWSSGYSTGHHSDGHRSDSSMMMIDYENQRLKMETERLQVERERLQEEKERNLTERERNMTERERCQIERERCAIERERCQIEKERLAIERRRLFLEESRIAKTEQMEEQEK